MNYDTGAVIHDMRYVEISKTERLSSGLGDFINYGLRNIVDYALGNICQGADIEIRRLYVTCVNLVK